jgi:hypothetical protein
VLLLVAFGACGGADDKIEQVRSAAEDFCACLPSQSEEDTCLSGVSSLEQFARCVESVLDTVETSPEVEGFVDCYEGKIDSAQSCINSSSGCDPNTVSSCIEVSGVYNCSAPANLQALIDDCL